MELQESAGEMLGAFCLRQRRSEVPKWDAQPYLGGIKTHSHLVEKSLRTAADAGCFWSTVGWRDGDTMHGDWYFIQKDPEGSKRYVWLEGEGPQKWGQLQWKGELKIKLPESWGKPMPIMPYATTVGNYPNTVRSYLGDDATRQADVID